MSTPKQKAVLEALASLALGNQMRANETAQHIPAEEGLHELPCWSRILKLDLPKTSMPVGCKPCRCNQLM